MASIENNRPRGSRTTRSGAYRRGGREDSAYTALSSSNASGSARKQVLFTTRSRLLPASSRIARRFSKAWRAWSSRSGPRRRASPGVEAALARDEEQIPQSNRLGIGPAPWHSGTLHDLCRTVTVPPALVVWRLSRPHLQFCRVRCRDYEADISRPSRSRRHSSHPRAGAEPRDTRGIRRNACRRSRAPPPDSPRHTQGTGASPPASPISSGRGR